MTRRFVAAYWLGYSSCAFIDPARRKEDEARLHLAGLVYAFWSLAVIELDLPVDDHAMSPSVAEHLVTAWLDQAAEAIKARDRAACGRIGSNPVEPEIARKLDAKFELLARALGTHLVLYSDHALDARQQENVSDAFLKAGAALLDRSDQQPRPEAPRPAP